MPLEEQRDRYLKMAKRRRARAAVHRAVVNGVLVRPDECSKCHKPCKPDGAHNDYDLPLDVTWLCRSCHRRQDVQRPTPITINDQERITSDLVPTTVYLPQYVIDELKATARMYHESLSVTVRRIVMQAEEEEKKC